MVITLDIEPPENAVVQDQIPRVQDCVGQA